MLRYTLGLQSGPPEVNVSKTKPERLIFWLSSNWTTFTKCLSHYAAAYMALDKCCTIMFPFYIIKGVFSLYEDRNTAVSCTLMPKLSLPELFSSVIIST